MKPVQNLALLIGAAALLGACSSTPTTAPASAPVAKTEATAPAPAAQPAPAPARPAPAPAPTMQAAHLDPNSPIARERSVFFDFDDFTVKSQYVPLIERQGRYLAAHPALAIKVEGNADERGSREYNLALGQKRAEAVVRALQIQGVKASQMEPVSWGKEKPVATGHDEAAWAQNRRVDLQYPTR